MKSALLIGALVFSLSLSAEEKPKLHSATKPEPRAGGWMKRHESFNTRVAKGNVDLVFIGDSITQGWGGKGKGVWAKFYGKRNT
ncbi:MAG: GDSL family lipase, partial [Verrucomicrobiia bacterium]